MGKIDRIYYLLILIISTIFLSDLFIAKALPATMDGLIHITSIAQFGDALSQHYFPVVWLNNFANYGLPVGLFSHQLPIYLGAIIDLLIKNPVLSTNLVTFLGVTLANIFFYKFLRIYFPELTAFLATVLFALAPYRILNVYIRGAVPETFSLFFLPFILICLHKVFVQRNKNALFLLVLGFLGLALTHPMMLLIYSFLIVPYFIFLFLTREKTSSTSRSIKTFLQSTIVLVSTGLIALGIATYYFLPLFIEKKYFNFGQSDLFNYSFLNFNNFIDVKWYYSFSTDIFTRGHVLQVGLTESIILLLGTILLLKEVFSKKKSKDIQLLVLSVCSGLLIVFFLLPISSPVYSLFSLLQNIQFPWRMLSAFVLIPPLIFAVLMNRFENRWIFYLVVLIVVVTRIPQLYGKNYVDYPASFYHSTVENLHSVNMNTLWTGKTEDYPPRTSQGRIIEGKGSLREYRIENSNRVYQLDAQTPVRLVDYTFYFPGWNVYVDGKKVPIEFQDPKYRGVITYKAPEGPHEIKVIFEDTMVRKVGKIISLFFIGLLALLFILRKKVLSLVYKYV